MSRSPVGGPALTDREAWLLSDVSTIGRLTVSAPQYNELRALAKSLRLQRDAYQALARAWEEGRVTREPEPPTDGRTSGT